MDPTVTDLQARAKAWNDFFILHPDAPQDSWESLRLWAQERSIPVTPDLWESKIASDTLLTSPSRAPAAPVSDDHQATGTGIIETITALPVLAISRFIPPRTMEEDPEFKKIEKRFEKEWQKNNPKKSWDTKEGLDFIYGSLDGTDSPTLHDLVEAEYRKPLTDQKKNEKRQKKIQKYDREREKVGKSKKNFEGDDAVIHVNRTIDEHTEMRYALKLKELPKATKEEKIKLYGDIRRQAEQRAWYDFTKTYRKKAEGYEKLFGDDFAKKYPVLLGELYKIRAKETGNALVESPMWEEQGGFAPEPPKQPPLTPPLTDTGSQAPPETPSASPFSPVVSQSTAAALPQTHQETEKHAPEEEKQREQKQDAIPRQLPDEAQEEAKRVLREYVKNLWNKIRRFTPRAEPPPPPAPEPPPSGPNPLSEVAHEGVNRLRNQAVKAGAKAVGNAARQAVTKVAAAALADNPITWIVIIIIIVIILLVIIIILLACVVLKQCGGPTGFEIDPIPGLTLNKTGPSSVANPSEDPNVTITYSISATYTGSGDVVLIDPIPPNTVFATASGVFTQHFDGDTLKTIEWRLKDNAPPYAFTITLRPTQDNIVIENTGYAQLFGDNIPSNPDATDFDSLMRGQGRNVGVLGDENTFTQKVIANGSSYNLAAREDYIRKIYRAAVARNVNPLIVATIWGEEGGFKLRGETIGSTTIFWEFGCDPYQKRFVGFDQQLTCSVNTWDNLMKDFEQGKGPNGTITIPSQIGNTCIYDDPFLYAAEKYGPVCVTHDGNNHFHDNFVKFYKMLLK